MICQVQENRKEFWRFNVPKQTQIFVLMYYFCWLNYSRGLFANHGKISPLNVNTFRSHQLSVGHLNFLPDIQIFPISIDNPSWTQVERSVMSGLPFHPMKQWKNCLKISNPQLLNRSFNDWKSSPPSSGWILASFSFIPISLLSSSKELT